MVKCKHSLRNISYTVALCFKAKLHYVYLPCCHDESLVVKVVLITRAYWSTRESCYSGLQLGIALIAIRVLLAFFLFLNCVKSLHRLFNYTKKYKNYSFVKLHI